MCDHSVQFFSVNRVHFLSDAVDGAKSTYTQKEGQTGCTHATVRSIESNVNDRLVHAPRFGC